MTPTLSVMATLSRAGEGAKLAADPRIAPMLQPAQKDALGHRGRAWRDLVRQLPAAAS